MTEKTAGNPDNLLKCPCTDSIPLRPHPGFWCRNCGWGVPDTQGETELCVFRMRAGGTATIVPIFSLFPKQQQAGAILSLLNCLPTWSNLNLHLPGKHYSCHPDNSLRPLPDSISGTPGGLFSSWWLALACVVVFLKNSPSSTGPRQVVAGLIGSSAFCLVYQVWHWPNYESELGNLKNTTHATLATP